MGALRTVCFFSVGFFASGLYRAIKKYDAEDTIRCAVGLIVSICGAAIAIAEEFGGT